MHIEGITPPPDNPQPYGEQPGSFEAGAQGGEVQPMAVTSDSALAHVPRAYASDRPTEPTDLPAETSEVVEGAEPVTVQSLRNNYAPYADPVRALLRQKDAPDVGKGFNKTVHHVPGVEGVVAKVYTEPIGMRRSYLVHKDEALLVATQAFDVFEKGRATSPEWGVVIADEIDGKPTELVDADMLDSLTIPVLRDAAMQVDRAWAEHGVALDGRIGNVMVSNSGLHIVNAEVQSNNGERHDNVNLHKLGRAIAMAGSRSPEGVDRAVRHAALGRFVEAVIGARLYDTDISYELNSLGRGIERGEYDGRRR